MAATQHGTAYVYGIDNTAPTSATILSINKKSSDRNTDKVPDHNGRIVSERDDDQLDVLEMELRYEAGFSKPAISSKLTVAGNDGGFNGDYKITGTDNGRVAQGLATYRISAEKGEYMTYT